MVRKILFGFLCLVVVAGAAAGVFLYQAKVSKGSFVGEKLFSIESGEDIASIAVRLHEERLVASKWYFLWSAWQGGLRGKVRAGDFIVPGRLTAPDVVVILRSDEGKPKEITLTFPEGWDSKKIAARLSANQFDGNGFLMLATDPPPELTARFPVLSTLPDGASLEGFLFPDTYTFHLEATPESILEKFLQNFEVRLSNDLLEETNRQGKTVFEIVTMASIVEREIGTANQSPDTIDRDRRMVSDLFWRRLKDDHALESDATVQYARGGEAKIQHSFEETRVSSPYNTYVNKGLPPGPIANPGLVSLRAAIFPLPNAFYFFLNNPETGETFFGRTFEEHLANKKKNGL